VLPLLSAVLPKIANLILRVKGEKILHKMHLVPADLLHRDRRPLKRKKRKYHPYEGCVKMRQRIGGGDIRQKMQTKAIVEFLRRVMPTSP